MNIFKRIWRYFFPVILVHEKWGDKIIEYEINILLSDKVKKSFRNELKKGDTINILSNDIQL